jgi:hypothetical protein
MKSFNQLFSTIFLLSFLTVLVFFSACQKGGNEAVPSSASSQIAFGLVADKSPINFVSGVSASSGILWTEGVANISKFEFEAKRNGVKTEIETEQLKNVNLFAELPSLINATIDSGFYREIEVKVLFVKSAGEIPLTLKGMYTSPTGASVPVEFTLEDNVASKVEWENLTVSNTEEVQSIITLHLNKLFAGINGSELETADRSANGIKISKSSNTQLYNKLLVNLSQSWEYEVENEHEKRESGRGK